MLGLTAEVWDQDRIIAEKLGALLALPPGQIDRPDSSLSSTNPSRLTLISVSSERESPSTRRSLDQDRPIHGGDERRHVRRRRCRGGDDRHRSARSPAGDHGRAANRQCRGRQGDETRRCPPPVAGPTIEVLNTDAEGRLILADGLGVVRRYEPD